MIDCGMNKLINIFEISKGCHPELVSGSYPSDDACLPVGRDLNRFNMTPFVFKC